MKASVLRVYELIPGANRQRFRNMQKCSDQTNVEFARELHLQGQRWCVTCKVKTNDDLIDLIFLEQFKSKLPKCVLQRTLWRNRLGMSLTLLCL